jgi:hypothetical protein
MPTPKEALDKSKKSINAAIANIQGIFGKSIDSKSMERIAKEAVIEIKRRTRLGYGVAEDRQPKEKLLSLSYEYIEQRFEMKEDGILSDATKPQRSNLTMTGQMLDSLRVINHRRNFAEISPYGSRWDSDLTNQEVSAYVEAAGRPYLNLSDLEIKKLARFYQNKILKPKLAKV